MRVSDIYQEVIEATGTTDENVNFRALTRAIDLLSTSGLFDPLVATIDFTIDGGFLIALPRDVKTPLRLNIENNPSFARNRIYEFAPNGAGSNDGEEVGWQWHQRGYSPIQDERKLPSKIAYAVVNSSDNGKTATVTGSDTDGRKRTVTLTGATHDSEQSEYTFAEITSVSREATEGEAYLTSDTGNIARYYPDEEQPEYRVIKVSKTGVAIRMLYRKHVFKISSLDDIIPLHSAMAVIRAVDAVRLGQRKQYQESRDTLAEAVKMITDEQETRGESASMAQDLEIQTAINTNINTNDVLIVADVYDMVSEVIGPVGKEKIFDRITDIIELLSNKSQWDSLLGYADLSRIQNTDTDKKCGYYALPRYVGSVLALNVNGEPGIPRNRWFEFHLNGTGSGNYASRGTWDDCGNYPLINRLPKDTTGFVKPTLIYAVPENALDEGALVTVYGVEQLADGSEVEIWRGGVRGWTCPCSALAYTPSGTAPKIVAVERIKRAVTTGFVSLYGFNGTLPDSSDQLLGYWYPDEVEPSYRIIKVPSNIAKSQIRIRYRKRAAKVTSLYDVLNLRSRTAVQNMARAIKLAATDPSGAMAYEQLAVNQLQDEQSANNPIMAGGLQFDPGTSPGNNQNIQ